MRGIGVGICGGGVYFISATEDGKHAQRKKKKRVKQPSLNKIGPSINSVTVRR